MGLCSAVDVEMSWGLGQPRIIGAEVHVCDSIAFFSSGRPFCRAHNDDFHEFPLDRSQLRHLMYELRFMSAFVPSERVVDLLSRRSL